MTVSFGLPSGSKNAPTLYINPGAVGAKAPSYGYIGRGAGAAGTFLQPNASPPAPPSPPSPSWGVNASVSGPTTVKLGQSITLSITYSVHEFANDPVPAQYPVQFNSGGGSSPYFSESFQGATDNGSGCTGYLTITGNAVGSGLASVLPGGTDANGNSRGYANGAAGNVGVNITVTN